jgi:hypothetical protein
MDNGNSTPNEDDTYLKCRNGVTIHRYSDNTLKIYFPTTGYANNRIKEIESEGVTLKLFQKGDSESTYLFSESDLPIIADILKAVTRGADKSPKVNVNRKKREYTEEEKEVLKERMLKMRLSMKNRK